MFLNNEVNAGYGDLQVDLALEESADHFFMQSTSPLVGLRLHVPYATLFPEQPLSRSDLPVSWSHGACRYVASGLTVVYPPGRAELIYNIDASCTDEADAARYIFSSSRGLVAFHRVPAYVDGEAWMTQGFALWSEEPGLGATRGGRATR